MFQSLPPRRRVLPLAALTTLLLANGAQAVDPLDPLDAPAAPSDAGSAMYDLSDLYNRLDSGAAGDKRGGAFTEPASGPTGATLYSLDAIMSRMPVADDTKGATAAEVVRGKTFWGLKSDGWGLQTGTLDISNLKDTSSGDATASDLLLNKKAWVDGVEVTGAVAAGSNVVGADGQLVITLPDGLYSGGKTVTARDANLKSENIAPGKTIFGVSGPVSDNMCLVDNTCDATAIAAGIYPGMTAYVDGEKITGTMPLGASFAGENGQLVVPIPDGYYESGCPLSLQGSVCVIPIDQPLLTVTAKDANLVAENIKQGVQIFGVAGTYPLAGVPKTGQHICLDAKGAFKECTNGEDGQLQKGIDWPSPRFTDNNNGTVTDNLTGLIWLKDFLCNRKGRQALEPWPIALERVSQLADRQCGLTDGSTAGQWRLPNLRELFSLIDFGAANPALPRPSPFPSIPIDDYYWSSTLVHNNGNVWIQSFSDGLISKGDQLNGTYYVWPVRGGQ